MRLWAATSLLLLAACSGGSSDEPRLATEPTVHVAKQALEQHNPELARRVATAILSHQPHNIDALVIRGDAYYEMHQQTLAAHDYQVALKDSSVSVGALTGLGRLRLSADPAQAETYFRRALDNDPRFVPALNNLGIACDMQNRHADAQANYRRALALQPGDNAVNVNLGLSLAMSGDKAGALEILQPLAENPETAARLRKNLATALNAAGDPDGAARVSNVDPPAPGLQAD